MATQATVEMVKVMDIFRDTVAQIREINPQTVNEYYQLLRAGGEFRDPLILEQGTNRLVSGHHRYLAYRKLADPLKLVPVIYKVYPNERELVEDAVKSNLYHGRPLSTYDKKIITARMEQLGASRAQIANLLGMDLARLETIAQQRVIVMGEDGTAREEPVKRDFVSLSGQTVTEEQFVHISRGRGVAASQHLTAVLTLLKGGALDPEDDTLTGLMAECVKQFSAFLKAQL